VRSSGKAGATAGRPRAVCLLGPTGTGKTDLAIRVAAHAPFEIISVDSAMVYRRMNIGTAKPGIDQRAGIPHHLIDVAEPWQAYSAGRFRRDALGLIGEICARGRIPLLVGGTMLYFHVLQCGLADLPEGDPTIRAAIDQRASTEGWAALHAELARVDPDAAARIGTGDRQRIQRALEVYYLTGQSISSLQRETATAGEVDYLRIGLIPGDRDALHRRLDARLLAMMAQGFLGEVEGLMSLPGMSLDCSSMRAVGYRQLWRHLAGEIGLQEAISAAQLATRRLAKRQLTWLRSKSMDLVMDPMRHDVTAQALGALRRAGVLAS
jgi:tRNA dimethylallyltransferase